MVEIQIERRRVVRRRDREGRRLGIDGAVRIAGSAVVEVPGDRPRRVRVAEVRRVAAGIERDRPQYLLVVRDGVIALSVSVTLPAASAVPPVATIDVPAVTADSVSPSRLNPPAVTTVAPRDFPQGPLP